MKNILVIGGSYFTGRVFLETLVALPEYDIYVFNRGNVPLQMDGIHHITGTREKDEDVARIPQLQWEAVIDFCAYTPEHISTMIRGLTGEVAHFIFISTTSVYGSDNVIPIQENGMKVRSSQPELGAFADYGLQKWQAECELAKECEKRQLTYTILRPAIIYGRYNYAPRESWFFDAVLNGKTLVVPGRAQALFSFVWVEDLARLLILVIENNDGSSTTYNVADPKPLSYSDLLQIFEKVCGRRPFIQKMAVKQICYQDIELPFPPDVHLQYDGRKIAAKMGFTYTPFSTGMKMTWQHYNKLRGSRC